jgi:hypothetical protein
MKLLFELKEHLPRLYQYGLSLFVSQSSNTGAESAFSKEKLFVNDSRCRLTSETVGKLLFVDSQIQIRNIVRIKSSLVRLI